MIDFLEPFFRAANSLLYGLFPLSGCSVGVHPFFVFCICGVVGVFLDLDHLVAKRLGMCRPFHLPFLVVVWVLCVCYGACCVGYS